MYFLGLRWSCENKQNYQQLKYHVHSKDDSNRNTLLVRSLSISGVKKWSVIIISYPYLLQKYLILFYKF